MKKELYLVLLLFILTPSGSVNAQMAELSSAVALLEKASSGQDALTTEEEEDDGEEEEESGIIREKTVIVEKNYGYTGAKDFANIPQEKFLDEPLPYFGYNFFLKQTASGTNTTNLPTPPDYVLGPGDEMVVRLFGSTNTTWELQVSKLGDVFLPGIGPIMVVGEVFQDFQKTVKNIINNQMVGTSAIVTMGELRSIDIFVLGEAIRPGMFTISSLTTLTNALFGVGGINVTGSLRNVQLKGEGKVITTLDFYDLLLKGDTSQDLAMNQGDVIFIPPIARTGEWLEKLCVPVSTNLKRMKH